MQKEGDTMLDQYNKDMSQQEHNHFEDTKANKKRIAMALSGATFALALFLFLMGLFRAEDAPKIARANTAGSLDITALETKVSELHKRLDRIEVAHAQIGQTNFVAQTDAPIDEQKNEYQAPVDSTPQNEESQNGPSDSNLTHHEAIALTNQAVLNLMVRHARTDNTIALSDTAAPQQPSSNTTNTSSNKATASTTPNNTGPAATSPGTYVVKKGDTLSKISKKFYGTPNRWQMIYEANRDRIPNMNNLRVGTTLVIPQK
jgi:nucleoid-associated protein YgaU